MFERETTLSTIMSLEIVGCIFLGIWGFSTARYYKGLSDGKKESARKIRKLEKKLAKKNEQLARKMEL